MVFIDRSEDCRRERRDRAGHTDCDQQHRRKDSRPIDRVRLNSKGEPESARHQQRSQRQWAESAEDLAPQKDTESASTGVCSAATVTITIRQNERIPRFMADT